MRGFKTVFMSVAAALVLGGCASGFKATYDSDPGHDFSGYSTFAWVNEHPMKVGASADRMVNPMLEPRIMDAVEAELKAKGFNYTNDLEAADFALSFTVGSRDEIKVDSYPSMTGGYGGYGYPGHWGGWGGAYYGYGTETSVRQYTKGMLAIDIFDVEEHRPVWHGVATKTIYDSDRKKLTETVNAAVNSIMVGFPPTK
jgi:hypothetical protein